KAILTTHVGLTEFAPGVFVPNLSPSPDDLLATDVSGNSIMSGGNSRLSTSEVEDGLATTLLVTESREQKFSDCDRVGLSTIMAGQTVTSDQLPRAGSDGHITAVAGAALNVGPKHAGDPTVCVPGSSVLDTPPVAWGPSSEHASGVINHLFADG